MALGLDYKIFDIAMLRPCCLVVSAMVLVNNLILFNFLKLFILTFQMSGIEGGEMQTLARSF